MSNNIIILFAILFPFFLIMGIRSLLKGLGIIKITKVNKAIGELKKPILLKNETAHSNSDFISFANFKNGRDILDIYKISDKIEPKHELLNLLDIVESNLCLPEFNIIKDISNSNDNVLICLASINSSSEEYLIDLLFREKPTEDEKTKLLKTFEADLKVITDKNIKIKSLNCKNNYLNQYLDEKNYSILLEISTKNRIFKGGENF